MKSMQTSWPNVLGSAHCQYHTFPWGKASYPGIIFIMSLLLIFFSACSNPLGGETPGATPTEQHLQRQMETPLSPLLRKEVRISQIMAGMSLDQKLGQLITVEYLGNDYNASGLQQMVTQQYVGGILYQTVNHNFVAPDNTVDGLAAFSRQIQQDTKIPLLIGTDEEGGQVNRLDFLHGPVPSAAQMAATGNPQYAFNQGVQLAKWMAQLGINSDLAPVVDVHTVDPPILQDRLFGSTPQAVATYAGAFLNGLQENATAGCLKHFPGLGALTADPHYGLPTINRSLSDLEKIDLAPYKLMISKEHPAMIMDTDVLMPAIDPSLPAELSPKAINGLLRGYLGYNGVVITDGLYMQGISNYWTLAQAATLALIAGNDLIEGPYTVAQVAEVISALKQALQDGKLTQARIDQSVHRILLMKLEYRIIK